MVYIGAIAIVILFAIMFARRIMRSDEVEVNQQWWYSLPIALVLFLLMFGVTKAIQYPVADAVPTEDSVLLLGLAFLGDYLIPFMVVSVLLSVALIGAIILARDKIQAEEAS
jgi:NADH-quinone oxidoreductase subunit J